MAEIAKSADSQDAVFALLGDPATYGGAAVRRCETHAAVVFLAGDRALKVKRAVRYPFLDYSTLARREAACRAELEINRNFAPQLYRRVVPITREDDGSLMLDGPGIPVEWAVEMARFDENNTLDHLAEREYRHRKQRHHQRVLAVRERSVVQQLLDVLETLAVIADQCMRQEEEQDHEPGHDQAALQHRIAASH